MMMDRFYIKQLEGAIHLYHRPSHSYLEFFESFEECADFLFELAELDDEKLWERLLFEYQVRMPHREVLKGMRKHNGWQESEDSLKKAWNIGTELFYEQYPDLHVQEEIPFDLIQSIHIKVIQRKEKAEKAAAAERIKAEKAYAKAQRKITLIGDTFFIRKVSSI